MNDLMRRCPALFGIVALLGGNILSGCGPASSGETKGITTDSGAIAAGKALFDKHCSACHAFQQDGIGPHLGGITAEISPAWISDFIRDPKIIIESGDERAALLFDRYKTVMPSFSFLSDEELQGLIAFMQTKSAPAGRNAPDPDALKNPIPEPISISEVVVAMTRFARIPASSREGQLTRICKLDFRPDTKELFVVDLRGKLYCLKNGQPELYLDIAREKPDFIDQPGLATGFGSFAFHPGFAANGLLYTTHVESAGSAKADFAYEDSIKVMMQWVLSEWKTDNPGAMPYQGKSRELMRINMVHSFHGVQEITFNPLAKRGDLDYGLLYIGIGDGSSVEFGFPFLAGNPGRIWGSIIRIDPAGRNSANGKYGIPDSNPFARSDDPGIVREIYAYGFRNPHRISWSRDGKMIASNIGHHHVEALYEVLPGHFYGWPIREGAFVMDVKKGMWNVYPLPPDDRVFNITYPIAQYDHSEGNAISGGFEYTGADIPELKGLYLFGDIVNGRLFYIETKDIDPTRPAPIREWRVSIDGHLKTLPELCGASKVDVRFGRDHEGEMYILTKPDGMIYKLVSAAN